MKNNVSANPNYLCMLPSKGFAQAPLRPQLHVTLDFEWGKQNDCIYFEIGNPWHAAAWDGFYSLQVEDFASVSVGPHCPQMCLSAMCNILGV